jgi:hypothetical protein
MTKEMTMNFESDGDIMQHTSQEKHPKGIMMTVSAKHTETGQPVAAVYPTDKIGVNEVISWCEYVRVNGSVDKEKMANEAAARARAAEALEAGPDEQAIIFTGRDRTAPHAGEAPQESYQAGTFEEALRKNLVRVEAREAELVEILQEKAAIKAALEIYDGKSNKLSEHRDDKRHTGRASTKKSDATTKAKKKTTVSTDTST